MECVEAAQTRAGEKTRLVEQGPGWVDEVDASQQVAHRGLVEIEAHDRLVQQGGQDLRETSQLRLQQCAGNDVLTFVEPIKVGGEWPPDSASSTNSFPAAEVSR